MNEYKFNLPKFTELSLDQQRALNDTNPIGISGPPGTGKSVVAVWRHINNITSLNKTSVFLTYTRTLATYIFRVVNTSKKDQNSTLPWNRVSTVGRFISKNKNTPPVSSLTKL